MGTRRPIPTVHPYHRASVVREAQLFQRDVFCLLSVFTFTFSRGLRLATKYTSDGHLALRGADQDMRVIANIYEHEHLLTDGYQTV